MWWQCQRDRILACEDQYLCLTKNTSSNTNYVYVDTDKGNKKPNQNKIMWTRQQEDSEQMPTIENRTYSEQEGRFMPIPKSINLHNHSDRGFPVWEKYFLLHKYCLENAEYFEITERKKYCLWCFSSVDSTWHITAHQKFSWLYRALLLLLLVISGKTVKLSSLLVQYSWCT